MLKPTFLGFLTTYFNSKCFFFLFLNPILSKPVTLYFRESENLNKHPENTRISFFRQVLEMTQIKRYVSALKQLDFALLLQGTFYGQISRKSSSQITNRIADCILNRLQKDIEIHKKKIKKEKKITFTDSLNGFCRQTKFSNLNRLTAAGDTASSFAWKNISQFGADDVLGPFLL